MWWHKTTDFETRLTFDRPRYFVNQIFQCEIKHSLQWLSFWQCFWWEGGEEFKFSTTGYVTNVPSIASHVHHVVPHVVAEALTAVPRLAGALAGHRPLARRHPLHRPRVRGRRRQGGEGRRVLGGRGGHGGRPHGGRGGLASVLLLARRRVQLGRVWWHGAAEKSRDQVWNMSGLGFGHLRIQYGGI